MTPSPIATAADYADAMSIARRAKNWLFLLLLIFLLGQLTLFFLVKYDVIRGPTVVTPLASPAAADVATTAPAVRVSVAPTFGQLILEDLISASVFLTVASTFVLAMVLLLIVNIMLIGRLIGVSRVTSAFVWCIVLAVLVFPWQGFLTFFDTGGADFWLPGVMYTWPELIKAHFDSMDLNVQVIRWARFVGFPLVAIILLLLIQSKSSRGVRLALGEAEPEPVEAPAE